MERGARGICRRCEGSLIWWKPAIKDEDGNVRPSTDRPRWMHMRPDLEAPNHSRNVVEDETHGYLGLGCPTNEGILPGPVGEPREYCTELKGEWPQVVCNKPVVDPELMMCGVHIKRIQEDEERLQKSRENNEFRIAFEAGMREITERLKDNFNLVVKPRISYYSVTPIVEVNPFELEELLLSMTTEKEDTGEEGQDQG